ncbi:MAG: inositol monophosphatase family protein [Corynebacterium sp.]|nr:inositol monophosphatase family protein [Corynebacterium sp.]
MDVFELEDIAVSVAVDAAELIRVSAAELGDISVGLRVKSSIVDPVTVVDEATEAFITERLMYFRPDDGLVGEEGNSVPSKTGVEWCIDPIDGTVNFLYGQPSYAVSIAATIDHQAVAGAVVQVPCGTVYAASKGHGAWRQRVGRDREALWVSTTSELHLSLAATGFAYIAQRRAQQAKLLLKVLPQVRDIRRLGSAALDLCMLAAGEVDVYYEHGLNRWDYLAGALIAAEAGAVVSLPRFDAPPSQGYPVRAATPAVAQSFFQLVPEAPMPVSS